MLHKFPYASVLIKCLFPLVIPSFAAIRSRLSYEQFGAFLANVKELNAHNQTKEVSLSLSLF